jgi:hypothetical protein
VLDKVREEYILNAQKVMAGRGAEGGVMLSTQRARLAAAQSEKAEFTNAIARGDFVSLSLMKEKLIAIFSVFREKTLTFPGKVADALMLHCAEDRNTITEILRDECYELLEDLSESNVLPSSTLINNGAPVTTNETSNKKGIKGLLANMQQIIASCDA